MSDSKEVDKITKQRNFVKEYILSHISIYDVERANRLGDEYLEQFLLSQEAWEALNLPELPSDPDERIKRIFQDLSEWNGYIVDRLHPKMLNRLVSLIKLFKEENPMIEDGESYMTFHHEGIFFDGTKTLVIRGGR